MVLNLENSLLNFCEIKDIFFDNLIAIGRDGTAVNTSSKRGVVISSKNISVNRCLGLFACCTVTNCLCDIVFRKLLGDKLNHEAFLSLFQRSCELREAASKGICSWAIRPQSSYLRIVERSPEITWWNSTINFKWCRLRRTGRPSSRNDASCPGGSRQQTESFACTKELMILRRRCARWSLLSCNVLHQRRLH